MTAHATITRDTLHSYSPARGVGVIERIKAEHEAHQFPSQLIQEYDQRIHPTAHIVGYGEGNKTEYVQFPGYHHPSQYPISPPLSREGTRTDTKHSLVAPSQYKSEVSPLGYSHANIMPSEEPDDDALEEEFSEPPRKKRKTQKSKKPAELPEHLSHFKSALSQIAAAGGYGQALLDEAARHVARSTQEALALLNAREALALQKKNEQEASTLCGVSWHRESVEFQEHFRVLAKRDSANNLKAFPDYKYAPSKGGKKDDKPVKSRASTKTGRVTRSRKPASKTKKLHHLSEEMLQLAIDEQQSPPAEAVHPQPYLTSVAFPPHSTLYAEGYGAGLSYVVYPDPDQYQRHYIATYGDVYSQSKISPPVVVHALYEDTENPNGNHNEGFIDPKLLLDQSGMHNSASYSVAIQQRSQPAPIERSRAEAGMSSWEGDVYAPFLSGRDGDWEVVKLDKRESNHEQLDGSESSFFGDALMAQAQEV
ncbi:female and male fertility-1 [Trichoderma harzianum]|uniref:Female and male fertility-1 n=1 Tax=Trichoderma harzianum TaxID=5544 RepID=A0A0F9ZT04_TRIHA|nr:female and male fertility-1 [Trichoderma harzianum]